MANRHNRVPVTFVDPRQGTPNCNNLIKQISDFYGKYANFISPTDSQQILYMLRRIEEADRILPKSEKDTFHITLNRMKRRYRAR